MTSPWWYRGRTYVFAAIYFGGFFFGALVSVALHGRYIPAVVELGNRLGPNGRIALFALAALCAAICYVLRVWGSSYLRAGIVWNADARSDTLLIAGPFRYVRNPLYLGNTFLAVAAGLMAPVAGCVFIIIANVVFVIALGRHEEVILERTYGERFRAYAAQVPSLVPRLTPVAAQGDVKPSLVQGLLSEVFTGAILLGIILAVVDQRRGGLDFFVLYVGGIIAQRMIARAQRPPVQAGTSP
ncbi:MAG TPA: methyltransferase [Candidatus Rubrimentiphilum sp.]|nr:methyltransferase [Candidatus Rubrimentiphilum sp.]